MTDVTVSRDGARVTIALTRPQKRNAVTSDMIDTITAAVIEADATDAAVIVLSGEPGFFSAGADIAGYREAAQDPETLADFTDRAKAMCSALSSARAVVVAVVDGVAMGGGFELVLSADLVVASDRSRFGLPEISLGLIPGWGGTQRFARFAGPNRAKEAVLLGEPIGAERALELGLVNRVVPVDQLEATAAELVDALVARAPLALAAGKTAVSAAFDGSDGAAVETRLLLELFASDDGREGIAAFVEKRAPRFTGR